MASRHSAAHRAARTHRAVRTRRGAWRAVALGISTLFVASGVVAVLTSPTQAAGSITFSKSADESVLQGGQVSYTLTASNPSAPGAVPQYNLGFRDVLPLGVTYVGGSTSPAAFGEPVVLTDPVTGGQVLVWQNVADLAVDQTQALTFKASVAGTGPQARPVGDTLLNTAGAYTHENPRTMPRFETSGPSIGQPRASTYSAGATDDASTSVTAIQVTKSEPSPEGELLRGVHDHDTVYTLTVTNNGIHPTNAVTVTDHLPASLEFLGCGTTDSSSAVEYPGAPRLDVSTQDVPSCASPASVTTVDSDLPTGYPAGVYTRVQWNVGTLAPGQSVQILYRAGVPMRSNVMPANPAAFVSTANLDNNTGAPTREGSSETSAVNRVRAEGLFQGTTLAGQTNVLVSAATTHTVSIEDLAVQKIADRGTFVDGQRVTYTLRVRTGEYASAADVVLTDQMQDGLCPLDATTNHTPAPGAPACAPGAGLAPSVAFASVTDNGAAGFTVVFAPISLGANQVTDVVYRAGMRDGYAADSEPTSAGDAYKNSVSLTGVTSTLPAQLPPGPTGPVTVADASEHTLGSGAPVLDKTIGAYADPAACGSATYGNSSGPGALTDGQRSFREGDRVCFRLRVAFPAGSSTRDAVLTDFLPDGVTYETGSVTPTAASTLTPAEIVVAEAADSVTFQLGTTVGAHRYVQPGEVFEVTLSGVVANDTSPSVDMPGNLAKLRWVDRQGRAVSSRDQVDFVLPPPPPVAVVKQVRTVTPTPTTPKDLEEVRHGTVVRYSVDVTNGGTAAVGNAIGVRDPEVWDVLPQPLRCGDVVAGSYTATSPSGTVTPTVVCTNPGQAGHPDVTGAATSSVVRWTVPVTIAPLEQGAANRLRLEYDVLVPVSTSQGVTHTNTAAVRTYVTPTNTGGTAPHFPASNVDRAVPASAVDTTAASDTAAISLPAATVSKTAVTSLNETGNSAAQAVPGETVTYTVSTTVKAGTTLYNGAVTDPLPANLTFVSAATTTATPPGTTLTSSAAVVRLTFPTTYTNATSLDQTFVFTVTARVQVGYASHNQARTNTATVTSTSGPSILSPAVTPQSASVLTTIVQPSPSLAKAASVAAPVAGQAVTYTLTAFNTAGRPVLHDTSVVDCVPTGLTVDPATLPPGLAIAADTSGCATGTGTKLVWTIGDLPPGNRSITYLATVSAAAAGNQAYVNRAALTGSTLPNDVNDTTVERVITTSANATVTVPGATPVKALAPGSEAKAVGDTVTYTVTVPFAANINFYDARVLDTLPAGLDVGSLQTVSVVCRYPDQTACATPTVGSTPLTSSDRTVGWFLGDLTSQTRVRTVVVTFTAKIADVASNQAGTAVANTASVAWNYTNKTDPTSVTATSDRPPVASNTVTTTVLEPQLGVAKTVSNPSPAPGDAPFTYSVTVTNQTGPNRAPAHDVQVVDRVPFGIVVDTATLVASGGAYDPLQRTITWTVPSPMAVGATQTFTYGASLAASSMIDTAARTNTVQVTSWESLATGGRTYPEAGDPVPTATATVTPRFPHVVVSKSVADPVAYAGNPTSFTITAVNDGTAPAFDVDLTDVLPEGWSFQDGSAQISVAGVPLTGAVLVPTDDGADPATLAWNDLAPAGLPVGATIVVSYAAVPSADALETPGVTAPDGTRVDHTNTVSVLAEDATGATANQSGSYAGPAASASAQIHSADLSVVKAGVGDPVAGTSFSWTLTVANGGPDAAVGPVTVTDTLPPAAQLSGVTAGGTGWSCSISAGSATCTHPGPVTKNQTLPVVTLTGTVASTVAADAVITNAATVTARTHDPDTSDNTSSVDEAVDVQADVRMVKSLTGALVAGETATYTLAVTNLGPSASAGPVVVTDTLPSGTTFVSATGPTGLSCPAPAGGVLTCTFADGLPLGGGFEVTVKVAVPADRTADVVNTATVDAPDDPNADNDSSTVTTTPDRTAVLSIEKALAGDDPLVSGAEGTYRLTVTNSGPSTATDVTITDVLPTYLTFVGTGSDATCSAAGQTVTCERPDELGVGADEAWELDLRVRVASGYTGDIENTASVTATEDPTGDDDTDSNTPDQRSDLTIEKSHTGEVVAGGDVTYTVEVTNDGPSDEPGPLEVVDTVPAGLTFTGGPDDGPGDDGWSCEAGTGADAGTVLCARTDGLTSGDSTSLDLTFTVASDAGPSTLTNRVQVDGQNTDPTPGNNVALDPTDVVDRVDLTVTKQARVASVDAGAPVTWDVVVTNAGPSDADSVTVTDTLPAGLSLVSVSGTGWTCPDPGPGSFTCSRPTLAPGAAPTLTVVTTVGSGVAPGSTILNTATVATVTTEVSTTNNSGEDSVAVTASADLELAKTVAPDQTPVAGEQLTFDLQVSNTGPSDAAGPVTVTDDLPAGMTYVGSAGPWTCTPGTAGPTGQQVVCVLDDDAGIVATAAAPLLSITVLLASDSTGDALVNEASATSGTTDPDGAEDTATVTPAGSVDLSVVKSHTGRVRVGSDLTFTFAVRNDGPSTATGVRLQDVLPAGLTLVPGSVSGLGWTCDDDTVDCTLDDPLAPQTDAAVVSMTVVVEPGAYPSIDNTATVGSTEPDRDTDDNSDTDTVAVPALSDLTLVKELQGTLQVGAQATYLLSVSNAGPTADPGPITVVDALPAGLSYVAAEGSGWDCEADDDEVVVCLSDDPLAVGASTTIELTVAVGPQAYPTATNSATVSSPSEDNGVTGGNGSTTTDPVGGRAALTIDKSLTSLVDRTATWSLTVVNTGPTPTFAPVVVTDDLPAGLTFRSAGGTGWTCGEAAGEVTCTYPAVVPVGTSLTLTVVTDVTAAPGSTITNVATVDGQAGGADVATASDDAVLELPSTGGPDGWIAAIAVLLILLGGLAVVRGRQLTNG
ncbi:isopeptide-forming domain-containing fimbrial protein [Aeromicrobium sp. Leaf350]|uniref:isopeptide-forming domain-containing fimbrial protein n=1 Tax=Aeromicrobium sp. Leaf350 TaxID=2876565 RepID=UPI001E5F6000|nr:isopeptide-forming domain-containing fimbrial protein [Aeromicrobium sp. Leaf350]